MNNDEKKKHGMEKSNAKTKQKGLTDIMDNMVIFSVVWQTVGNAQ